MADAWEWIAEYADGSRVREREAGTFTAVDLERCVAVELLPRWRFWRKRVRVSVDLARGQRAVCFRRRRTTVILNPLAVPAPGGTLTVVGWESPEGSTYVVAEDNGRVHRVDNLAGL